MKTTQIINFVLAPKYQSIEKINDNLYVINKDNKFGLVDSKGKAITPIIYDDISPQPDGTIEVFLDNQNFSMDKTGKLVQH